VSTHGAVRHTAAAFLDAGTAALLKERDLSFYTGDGSAAAGDTSGDFAAPSVGEWQVRFV
jgi:hypothetical protein